MELQFTQAQVVSFAEEGILASEDPRDLKFYAGMLEHAVDPSPREECRRGRGTLEYPDQCEGRDEARHLLNQPRHPHLERQGHGSRV